MAPLSETTDHLRTYSSFPHHSCVCIEIEVVCPSIASITFCPVLFFSCSLGARCFDDAGGTLSVLGGDLVPAMTRATWPMIRIQADPLVPKAARTIPFTCMATCRNDSELKAILFPCGKQSCARCRILRP